MTRDSDHDRIVTLEAQMEFVLPVLRGLERRLSPSPPPRDIRAEHDRMQRALDQIAISWPETATRTIAREAVRDIGPLPKQ